MAMGQLSTANYIHKKWPENPSLNHEPPNILPSFFTPNDSEREILKSIKYKYSNLQI